jgi:hypothetical protein
MKKVALALLSTLTLLGCASDSPQRLPGPTPLTQLWGMVVEDSGVCIAGATITVVAGQRAGQSIKQTTPCDAWAISGGVVFRDLTPGVAMTLRASAAGYADEEKTVVPHLGPQTAVLFVALRAQ